MSGHGIFARLADIFDALTPSSDEVVVGTSVLEALNSESWSCIALKNYCHTSSSWNLEDQRRITFSVLTELLLKSS